MVDYKSKEWGLYITSSHSFNIPVLCSHIQAEAVSDKSSRDNPICITGITAAAIMIDWRRIVAIAHKVFITDTTFLSLIRVGVSLSKNAFNDCFSGLNGVIFCFFHLSKTFLAFWRIQ